MSDEPASALGDPALGDLAAGGPSGRDPALGDLAIGEVAAAAGVAVSAIRYYEQRGIVVPSRRVGGKRRFHSSAVGTVNFVRRAQQLGFSLDDIKAILDDRSGVWPELVRARLQSLIARRAELDAMIELLREVERCGCAVVADCPRVVDR